MSNSKQCSDSAQTGPGLGCGVPLSGNQYRTVPSLPTAKTVEPPKGPAKQPK